MKLTEYSGLYRAWKQARQSMGKYPGNKGLFLETVYSIGDDYAFDGTDGFVIAWLHEFVLSDYHVGSRRLDAVVNCIDIDWLWESELSQTMFAIDYMGDTYIFVR